MDENESFSFKESEYDQMRQILDGPDTKVVVTTICQALHSYVKSFENGYRGSEMENGDTSDERYKIASKMNAFMIQLWEDLHRHDVDEDEDYQR